MTERLYHVVAINERTHAETLATAVPCSHHEACVILGRFTPHPLRRVQLREVSPPLTRQQVNGMDSTMAAL